MRVDNVDVTRISLGCEKSAVEFVFRPGDKTSPAAEHLRDLGVFPRENVVVRSVVNMPLSAIPGIVQDKNDGI